ncbi:bifunctional 2-polyprenyl-6-hydroxyphenol methylase/3-demethylubiquinol 3-O-methyltransferase UbiG [Lentisalinibacter sediminis]|uniref:bifunctional 2-polyprenyl-6-hydroxyphenol methylase/3-demethylubiquinol 3-O-methyltransferase UbiG n=1 Tax=Lentisalinibacter sediminis TaxID=2992237 RepID=UPI00386ADDFC
MNEIRSAASIDEREVRYYSELAETWWDRDGPFWPLHTLNRLRVAWIRDRLCEHWPDRSPEAQRPLEGLSVLDVGCGGGILSESMAHLGASVHGIDVVEKNIGIARAHAHESGRRVRYDCVTAESLAAAGARYDVVLNMEVVEHVADLPGFMRACTRLVGEDGVMFVSTINRTPLSWLPKGTHRWSLFRKPDEIRQLLERGRLETLTETGVRVNPFTKRMSLQSSNAVNYMLLAAR